jgi:hypothetical protein
MTISNRNIIPQANGAAIYQFESTGKVAASPNSIEKFAVLTPGDSHSSMQISQILVAPVWKQGGQQFNSYLVIRIYPTKLTLADVDDTTPFVFQWFFPLNQFFDPTAQATNALSYQIQQLKFYCTYQQSILIGVGKINDNQDFEQEYGMQFRLDLLGENNLQGANVAAHAPTLHVR